MREVTIPPIPFCGLRLVVSAHFFSFIYYYYEFRFIFIFEFLKRKKKKKSLFSSSLASNKIRTVRDQLPFDSNCV